MKIIKLIINTNSQKYPIIIGSNILKYLSKILNKNSIKFKKCLLVIDKNIPKKKNFYYQKKFKKCRCFCLFYQCN